MLLAAGRFVCIIVFVCALMFLVVVVFVRRRSPIEEKGGNGPRQPCDDKVSVRLPYYDLLVGEHVNIGHSLTTTAANSLRFRYPHCSVMMSFHFWKDLIRVPYRTSR